MTTAIRIPDPPRIPDAELEAALQDPSLDAVLAGDDRTIRERIRAAWDLAADEHPYEFHYIREVLRPGEHGGGGHGPTEWRGAWNTLWPGRPPTVAEWVAFVAHHQISVGGGSRRVWAGDKGYLDLAFKVSLQRSPHIFPVKPELPDWLARGWWLGRLQRCDEVGIDAGYTTASVDAVYPPEEHQKRYSAMDVAAWARRVGKAGFAPSKVTRVTPEGADGAALTYEEALDLQDGDLVRLRWIGGRATMAHVRGAVYGDTYP